MTDNSTLEKKEEHEPANNKDGKIETGYVKIFITALITAVFTSITQYFLQNSKLTGEQDYWRKRYNIETIDKINTQRLQLVEELNKELLQLEVNAKDIKLSVAASKYVTKPEEIKALGDKFVQYQKDLYLYAAKSQITALYFGDEVNNLIPKLGKELQLNFNNNLLLEQPGIKLPEFDLDFETIDTLEKTRLALMKAMIDEIVNSSKIKMNDKY